MSCFAHLDGSTFLLISLNILTYTPLLVIIHIRIGNACMYVPPKGEFNGGKIFYQSKLYHGQTRSAVPEA